MAQEKAEQEERLAYFWAGEALREEHVKQELDEADQASLAIGASPPPPSGTAAEAGLEVLRRRIESAEAQAVNDRTPFTALLSSRRHTQQGFTGRGTASNPLGLPPKTLVKGEKSPSHQPHQSQSGGYLTNPDSFLPVVFVDTVFAKLKQPDSWTGVFDHHFVRCGWKKLPASLLATAFASILGSPRSGLLLSGINSFSFSTPLIFLSPRNSGPPPSRSLTGTANGPSSAPPRLRKACETSGRIVKPAKQRIKNSAPSPKASSRASSTAFSSSTWPRRRSSLRCLPREGQRDGGDGLLDVHCCACLGTRRRELETCEPRKAYPRRRTAFSPPP
jgi:hypothetical protein